MVGEFVGQLVGLYVVRLCEKATSTKFQEYHLTLDSYLSDSSDSRDCSDICEGSDRCDHCENSDRSVRGESVNKTLQDGKRPIYQPVIWFYIIVKACTALKIYPYIKDCNWRFSCLNEP